MDLPLGSKGKFLIEAEATKGLSQPQWSLNTNRASPHLTVLAPWMGTHLLAQGVVWSR